MIICFSSSSKAWYYLVFSLQFTSSMRSLEAVKPNLLYDRRIHDSRLFPSSRLTLSDVWRSGLQWRSGYSTKAMGLPFPWDPVRWILPLQNPIDGPSSTPLGRGKATASLVEQACLDLLLVFQHPLCHAFPLQKY